MSTPQPYPKFCALDTDTGFPLVDGQVYTHYVGTSSDKTTYSNKTLTTPNTNPVILDSRGEAVIYLSGPTDVTLKDANGIKIWGPITINDITDLDDALGVYRPETYGALGNGVNNDSTAIQSAFTAAAITKGRVYFSDKSYVVNNTVRIYSDTVVDFGCRSTITSTLATESAGDCPGAGVGIFEMRGTAGTPITLSVNGVAGANSISLSSVGGLTAGDLVRIYDNTTDNGVAYVSEMNIIASVSAPSTVNLRYPINFAYATASGASLVKITPIQNVVIKGSPTFNLSGAGGDVSAIYGIYTRDCSVEGNVQVKNFPGFGVMFLRSLNPKTKGVVARDATNKASGHGYGERFWDCRHWESRSGYYEFVRHAVDWVGGSDYLVDGARAVRCTTDSGVQTVGAFQAHGLRSKRGVISNCNAQWCGNGIRIGNGSFDADDNILVSNFTANGCILGIYVQENSSNIQIDNFQIANCIDDPDAAGFDGAGIHVQSCSNVNVRNGRIVGASTHTNALINFWTVNGGSVKNVELINSPQHALNISGSTNISASGNTISGSASRAIYGTGMLGIIQINNNVISHSVANNTIELQGAASGGLAVATMIADDNLITGTAAPATTAGIFLKDYLIGQARRNVIKTVVEGIRFQCVDVVADNPIATGNIIDTTTNAFRLVDTVGSPMATAMFLNNYITNASGSALLNSAGATLINATGLATVPTNANAIPANSDKIVALYDHEGNVVYVPGFNAPW